jgi:hypothetical protein
VTTDFNTQVIENDLLRVTLLPGWGARILSIYYKPQNMELLSYAKGSKYSEVIYAEGRHSPKANTESTGARYGNSKALRKPMSK